MIQKIKNHINKCMGNFKEFVGLKNSFLGVQSYNATLVIPQINDKIWSYTTALNSKNSVWGDVSSFNGLTGVVITLIGYDGGQWFLPSYNGKFVGMIKISETMSWVENSAICTSVNDNFLQLIEDFNDISTGDKVYKNLDKTYYLVSGVCSLNKEILIDGAWLHYSQFSYLQKTI
jgi:hypothetical protein